MERKFRSQPEVAVARQLTELQMPIHYEERRFPYTITHHYTPDFWIVSGSGAPIFIEVKGHWFSDDRTKTLAVLKDNPELDLRFVFTHPKRKLRKGSTTSYADWCDTRNIPWAWRRIPKEWLDE